MTHGDYKSPEFKAWAEMRSRCRDTSRKDYKDYGGRGITIDPAWRSYKQFLADMGRRLSPKHTLERVDNNLGYSKSNCVWATRKAQVRNRRIVRLSMALANMIRQECANGLSQASVGRSYGVSRYMVYRIVHNKNWT